MFEDWVTKELKKHVKDIKLEVPPDSKLGDYAFACFPLAKQLKKNPVQIAKELAEKIKPSKKIQKVIATGPYVNFFLNPAAVAEHTLKAIFKEKKNYGKSKTKKETYWVEFFHANTHKGVHIGHLRTLSIGAAVSNLLEAVGKKVIRMNYQGDIGPHVAKCLWGYLKLKEKEPKEHKGIWLGKIYAKASQKAKDNKKIEQEIKEINKKIYNRDKEIFKLWQKTRKWCLADFDDFYKQWGVKYDRLYLESEVDEIGLKEFKKLVKKGIAKESDGAIIVNLEDHGLKVYVAITGQKVPTYYGKELGLASLKLKEYKKPHRSLHVVGTEQEMFFNQMFKTFELMKSPLAKISTHIKEGLVMLPEGKMSSREGTMILYHNLYTELMRLATKEIKQRHKELNNKEVEKRAQMITFSAIKYSMVQKQSHKNITFDWKKSLEFEGDTGPYLQYAHARCASILRKAKKEKVNTKVHFESLNTEHEHKLIKHLALLTKVVQKAALEYKPYLLANYLLDLAQYFTEFYHNCPVISDLTEVMHARLLLTACTKQVLSNGLNLLGIKAPDEM